MEGKYQRTESKIGTKLKLERKIVFKATASLAQLHPTLWESPAELEMPVCSVSRGGFT